MAPTIASSWRAFWHTMTSNDRHASHDSPYRTGQHVPLPQSQRSPLSSSATSALESRTDLDLESGHGFVSHSSAGASSPPYSPNGRRSIPRQGSSGMDGRLDGVAAGEIQMQSFSDGLPPPPPVNHSWKRIDRWLEDNYEELFENIGEPATVNDVNELEHELDCTLPTEVRESLQIHDGQERGGRPTGIIFGCMLLDCEEIIQEWQNWRTVNEAYLIGDIRSYEIPQAPLKAFAGSSSTPVPVAQAQSSSNPQWQSELLDKQDSQPPNAVQKVYAHPAWIPLARDWGGNNIAVDLAPGPAGKWGQVILMGRDYDCKYVISRSWSAFLATLADDMNTDKWFIDEDTKELKLRAFKQPGVEPAYIDILRWRSDQKYGRRGSKKRSLHVNPNANSGPGSNSANGSPYGSPTSEDRGRSPQRFANGKAPATSSPRAHVGSPLARVTEEQSPIQPAQPIKPQPLSISTNVDAAAKSTEKLISGIDTPPSAHPPSKPNASLDSSDARRGAAKSKLGNSALLMGDEEDDVPESTPLSPHKGPAGADSDLEGEMRDVQI